MKKTYLLLAVLHVLSLNGQEFGRLKKMQFAEIDTSLFSCVFEYRVRVKDKQGKLQTEIYNTFLQVGKKASKFWDYSHYALDSVLLFSDNASEEVKKKYEDRWLRSVFYFEQEVFQNYPANKIMVTDVIVPNKYVYTQDLKLFEWQLLDDTMEICGYSCQKAIGSYGGKKWTAWYTMDIPSSFGPWKFHGLPGLILQARDEEKIHVFKAISIQNTVLPIYLEKDVRRMEISKGKFIENKMAFEKDPIQNIPVESISGMRVVKFGEGKNEKTTFINGVQFRQRPNGYSPLEHK